LHYNSPENISGSEKEYRWKEIISEVERVTDRLGKTIDSGIIETVVAFKALGLQTVASCEGHLDYGIKAPWVDIGSVSDDTAKVALTRRKSEKQIDNEDIDKVKETLTKIYTERKRILDLLNEFYMSRGVTGAYRLIALSRLGETRIINQGYDIQDGAMNSVQAEKLAEYQKEMQQFGQWMKDKYFSQK
jgi:hypothetical protein